jgi:hypothetical protein
MSPELHPHTLTAAELAEGKELIAHHEIKEIWYQRGKGFFFNALECSNAGGGFKFCITAETELAEEKATNSDEELAEKPAKKSTKKAAE